jgi:hypothetical protein
VHYTGLVAATSPILFRKTCLVQHYMVICIDHYGTLAVQENMRPRFRGICPWLEVAGEGGGGWGRDG